MGELVIEFEELLFNLLFDSAFILSNNSWVSTLSASFDEVFNFVKFKELCSMFNKL